MGEPSGRYGDDGGKGAGFFERERNSVTWVRPGAAVIASGTWIGSGVAVAGDFYLRAGAGLDRPAETAFTDLDCSRVSPANDKTRPAKIVGRVYSEKPGELRAGQACQLLAYGRAEWPG